MKNYSRIFVLFFFSTIYFSCTKDKSSPISIPTSADTISAIIDSVEGRYRVFVTKDSFEFGDFGSDTLGFDTIEVLRAEGLSISVLDNTLSLFLEQSLSGPDFYFGGADTTKFPPMGIAASFFTDNDSIEIMYGYFGDFEWGNYFYYRGKKIP